MKRYLIVNADDCGFDTPTTDGVFDAHLNGIVSSTSVVVNFDGFTYAAKRLLETPTLRAGVHLNFYQGKPVLEAEKIPSLINPLTGEFDPIIQKSAKISPIHLKAEFRAQIEKFLAAGLTPTHLDNHRPEIYLDVQLFTVVIDLAEEYRLPIRMPFDKCFARDDQKLTSMTGVPWEIVQARGKLIRDEVVKRGISFPDYFCYEFTTKGRTIESLCEILRSLPEGISEICTHPGHSGDRQIQELKVLLSPKAKDIVSAMDINLSSFEVAQGHSGGNCV
jgi:predicted glycoside hydrolase/deacetylase ChbG (UPF0249 family)